MNIVHFSDLHLFEKPKNRAIEEPINEHTFRLAIHKSNTLKNVDFVVLTGDIGVEQLLIEDTVKAVPNTSKYLTQGKLKEPLTTNDLDAILQNPDIKARWTQGVEKLAMLIGESQITTWLFIPGNNDLWQELDTTIVLYQQFVKQVAIKVKQIRHEQGQRTIEVIDFRPEGNKRISGYEGGVHIRNVNGLNLLFAGFNNASFKNEGEVNRLFNFKKDNRSKTGHLLWPDSPITVAQRNKVALLRTTVESRTYDFAYLFFHIPPIDDPWTVTKKGKVNAVKRKSQWDLLDDIGLNDTVDSGYEYSAWLVGPDVRQKWLEVLGIKKVKGLLSGHFHAEKRETYQLLSAWQKTVKHKYPSLAILKVVPPIAVKNDNFNARGFQLLNINRNGVLNSTILWFNHKSKTFD